MERTCLPNAAHHGLFLPGYQAWKKSSQAHKKTNNKKRGTYAYLKIMKKVLRIIPKRFSIFFTIFVPRVPYSVPVFYTGTFCTIFSRMPGFEPELLRQQPGVLPMSNTHSIPSHFLIFICFPDRTCRPHTSAPLWGDWEFPLLLSHQSSQETR